jgi:hypothetical protein
MIEHRSRHRFFAAAAGILLFGALGVVSAFAASALFDVSFGLASVVVGFGALAAVSILLEPSFKWVRGAFDAVMHSGRSTWLAARLFYTALMLELERSYRQNSGAERSAPSSPPGHSWRRCDSV